MALLSCKDCEKEFNTAARKCPHCGARRPQTLAQNIRGWSLLTLLVVLGLSGIAHTSRSPVETASLFSASVPMPDDEKRFIDVIEKYRSLMDSAPNDMAIGGLRHQRKLELCRELGGMRVRNWVGIVEELSSNADGKGVLSVRLATNLTLGTVNNVISDALLPSKTLLDQASRVFVAASKTQPGTRVRFSGRFFNAQNDCLWEQSLTLSGAMSDPEFIFQFSALSPIE